MKNPGLSISIAFLLLCIGNAVFSQNYVMDKYHSRLGFSVPHFGISKVDGNFRDFDAKLISQQADFSDAEIEMTARAESINTDVQMRDNDLKSSNFFDVKNYPQIIFKSSSFRKITDSTYLLSGNISIRGITKPIIFNVKYNGEMVNPYTNKTSVGFTVTGKLNRKDFKVGTGPTSISVGDEVDLISNVEFFRE